MLLLRQTYPSSCDCPLEKLLSILGKLLSLVPIFTLLVDALDECDGTKQDTDRLLEYLVTLGEQPDARVILLFRNNAHSDKFIHSNTVYMDQFTVEPDIMLFLE